MRIGRVASHVEYCQLNEMPLIHPTIIYISECHVLVTEHGFVASLKVFQFDLFTRQSILIGLNENQIENPILYIQLQMKSIKMSITFFIRSLTMFNTQFSNEKMNKN